MHRLAPRPLVAAGIGLLVAAAVLLAVGQDAGALFVGGIGALLLTSAVFYAVGRSEDLERRRDSDR